MLERGGNAVDACLAAAAVLCVTEPMSTGVGGDAFAMLWQDGRLVGLDAAGPAPARADPLEPVEERGPRSVTVPGAVAGWGALSRCYGRLGLDACLGDAIDIAERGFAVARMTARAWSSGADATTAWAVAAVPPEYSPPPVQGERIRFADLGGTLRAIADDGPVALYTGRVARAIADVTWLDEEDLAAYRPRWVEPLRMRYRDLDVAEMPPPTQGVAALEALGLLDGLEPTLANQIRCAQLALEDARTAVRDGADVSRLLSADHLARRRELTPVPAAEPGGGTVYLCAIDAERTAVSFIQSLYGGFGSGLVAPGTGVVLQNRGACFGASGRVEPGRRPYHTIIPGMLVRDDLLVGPFGVMGGFIQAQAHMQLVSGIVDEELDPQAALDKARFRVEGDTVFLEEGMWDEAATVERLGYRVVLDRDTLGFGGGQAILTSGETLIGGSDPRKDGYAAGL